MTKKKKVTVWLPIKIHEMLERIAPLFMTGDSIDSGNMSEAIRFILVEFYDSPKYLKLLQRLEQRNRAIRFELMMERAKLEAITRTEESH